MVEPSPGLEIIADDLSNAEWSCGCVPTVDAHWRAIFVADAHAVNCLDNLTRFLRNYPDMKTSIPLILITFSLVCSALLQDAQAVNPPPDGAYSGGNTAEGQNALFSLTNGNYNTAIGAQTLYMNLVGNYNTAIGAQTLFYMNVGGFYNTAIGYRALHDTTGDANTANGNAALGHNTTGTQNTAIGYQALLNTTTGTNNVALGVSAGSFASTRFE